MKNKKEKTHIKVFITKYFNFRARINEPGCPIYEVTINGKEWTAGIGRQHQKRILKKAQIIMDHLKSEYMSLIAYNIDAGKYE